MRRGSWSSTPPATSRSTRSALGDWGAGAGVGACLVLLGPAAIGVGVLGGTAAGGLIHKGLKLSDQDKARIAADLGAGKAAVGVLARIEDAAVVQKELTGTGRYDLGSRCGRRGRSAGGGGHAVSVARSVDGVGHPIIGCPTRGTGRAPSASPGHRRAVSSRRRQQRCHARSCIDGLALDHRFLRSSAATVPTMDHRRRRGCNNPVAAQEGPFANGKTTVRLHHSKRRFSRPRAERVLRLPERARHAARPRRRAQPGPVIRRPGPGGARSRGGSSEPWSRREWCWPCTSWSPWTGWSR